MKIVYTSTNYKNAVIRSVLGILLGIVLVTWPGAALKYIIMAVGIIFLVIGLISFSVSYQNRANRPGGMMSVSGMGSIILGLLLVCIPTTFATIFLFVLGFLLLLAAVGQWVTVTAARQFGHVSVAAYVFPALIFIVGLIVLFTPREFEKTIFILFGVTSIFYGITNLWNQYTINRLRKQNEEHEKIVKMEGSGDAIEDVDFEEVHPDDEK